MQYIKNSCFINDIMDFKTTLLLLDENYKILQYKVLDKSNDSKLNHIYCGIIEKIDYGIESVFVKISEDLVGFLPFRQFNSTYYDKNTKKLRKKINKGDKLLVQVIRDSVDSKSLKLTNNIAFSSVFCVFMPFEDAKHGISSNIKAEQRMLLKSFLKSLDIAGSLIVRTSATESSIQEIEVDFVSLKKTFHFILNKFKKAKTPQLLFHNDELIQILHSYSLYLIDTVFVRSKTIYDLLVEYNAQKIIKFPSIKVKNDFEFLKLIDDQLDLLYQKELILPSNGSIVIEKTEAMVTIDVNSKRCIKCKNMEETSFKLNMEAVDLIVDQIILRNLAGIIAIDLIDMQEEKNIQAVFEKFKQAFKRDKASIKILPINLLGVLQLSRERKGLSLLDLNYEKCSHCQNGLLLSQNFLACDFIQKLFKYSKDAALDIHLNKDLFNYIFMNYQFFVSRYLNLKWQITNEHGFKINQCKC